MKHIQQTGFAERLSSAADAKKALLAKFKPKPSITAPEPIDRNAEREVERDAVRQARVVERETAKAAKAAAEEAARLAALQDEQAMLEAKRSERKGRKQMMKSDAQAKRAARLAAYSGSRGTSGSSLES